MTPAVAAIDETQKETSIFHAQLLRIKDAVLEGDLKMRLNTDEFGPKEAASCQAINTILDTIVETYERAVTSVDGMCVGQIPEPFSSGFPGDFARAMRLCNEFIDVINRRNKQIAIMTEAAAKGVRRKPYLYHRHLHSGLVGVCRRLVDALQGPPCG